MATDLDLDAIWREWKCRREHRDNEWREVPCVPRRELPSIFQDIYEQRPEPTEEKVARILAEYELQKFMRDQP